MNQKTTVTLVQEEIISKSETLKKLERQHEIEIEDNNEWCEQRIVWQDGKIIHYEKREKYQ